MSTDVIFSIKDTPDSYEIYCKGKFVGDIWKNASIEILCCDELECKKIDNKHYSFRCKI